jgi:pimeloyl-ACP methyl ester carboxylesterase
VILAIAAGFAVAMGGALFLLQDRMIYFPCRYNIADVAGLYPEGTQRLELVTNRGRRACAYFVPAKEPSTDGPVWYVFGGNASLALDWNEDVHEAQKRDPRVAFVLIEYPGYGETFDGRRPRRSEIRPLMQEIHAEVARRLGIAPDALATRSRVFGYSLGSAIGTEFAADIGAPEIVLVAPFTSLLDMARRSVFPPYHHLLRDRWDTRARLAELAALGDRRPRLTIYHGDADHVVPVEMGRALSQAYPGATYRELPGQNHESLLPAVFPK